MTGRPASRRHLGHLATVLAVALAAAILFWEAGPATGTLALFGAGTNNGSSFGAVAVYSPPANPTASVVDDTVQLSWPAAQPANNGNGNGYVVSSVNVQPPTPAGPNCATQTYSAGSFNAGVALANPTVSFTDPLSGQPPAGSGGSSTATTATTLTDSTMAWAGNRWSGATLRSFNGTAITYGLVATNTATAAMLAVPGWSNGTPTVGAAYVITAIQDYAGSWSCFQVLTGYSNVPPGTWSQVPGISGAGTQGWYSVQNPRTVRARIGFFSDSVKDPNDRWLLGQPLTSVVVPRNGTGVPLRTGDVFRFNFAGATTQPTYVNDICSDGTTIFLSDWDGGCTVDELGTLTGGTMTGAAGAVLTARWTWVTSSQLTATITNLNGANAFTTSGSWTFNPVSPQSDLLVGANQTFVIHYSQPTNQPAIPATDGVCFTNPGPTGGESVYLAHNGNCSSSAKDDIGFLLGGSTLLGFGADSLMSASYVWTNSQTLTITITNLNGNLLDLGGTWTFTPSNTGTGTKVSTADARIAVCSPPPAGQLATQSCLPTNS